jgi:phosphatidylethanolamine/phosphatidyl-N-methylethanolamine N-methyltransferase
MPLQALQLLEKKIERHIRLFELRKGAFERKIEQKIEQQIRLFELRKGAFERKIERKIERQIRLFELKKGAIERSIEEKIETQIRRLEAKKGIRLDDEVRFIRSWLEKPFATGAMTPSGKILARTMARYVDPDIAGPIVELGPGTGAVTDALIDEGVDPMRLVLVEFNPTFCQLLRVRFPKATVVHGDAYGLRHVLGGMLQQPAAAFVSGLPLINKPVRTRLALLREAFELLGPGAPFVQFTYAVVPPIPKALGVRAEASERIWMNFPPARVWVYRKG